MGKGLVVDLFAGGGGASLGISWALGREVDVAVNHDAAALAAHGANHPGTRHFQEDVFAVDPHAVCGGREVELLWASPDCTHHSKAKGGKPREHGRRSLAWVVIRWAAAVRPAWIMLENVEEFAQWGPLGRDGRACKARKGRTFAQWVGHLEGLGYRVEWRELRACDYGAPTSRKRLFVVARRDGGRIVWPEPSHGPGRGAPYRTAAECIDWGLPCPSIFERKKPLAEATLRRIARGIQRFVVEAAEPFVVNVANSKTTGRAPNCWPLEEPVRTVTTSPGFALVAPTLVQTGYGERAGQAARAPGLEKPLGTVVAGGAKHALVAAFLSKFRGTSTGSQMGLPMPTVTASGTHLAEVRAFLVKYYGAGTGQGIGSPVHTVTTKDRLGLVMVAGVPHEIADIGLRMLQPHELKVAQGFPADYRLPGTKAVQVRLIGNSVPPQFAEALVRANLRAVELGRVV